MLSGILQAFTNGGALLSTANRTLISRTNDTLIRHGNQNLHINVQVKKYFLYSNQLRRVQWPQALRIKSPQASDHTEPPFRKCHDAHRQGNTTLQRKFWRREQVPTYPLQALCSVQYAIYNVQCAICNLCNMQCAIWNMQYGIWNMQYAVCNSNVQSLNTRE